MFIIDSLLVGGLRFVLDKVAAAVDQELTDETALRERLLAAQMQVELGEVSEAEFERVEQEVLARLREIREGREGAAPALSPSEYRITGVDATIEDEHHS